MKQDNQELRNQLDLADKSRLSAKKDADSLTAMHQALLTDHDRLQKLHDLLTQDYEQAKQDNQEMKLKLRNHRVGFLSVAACKFDETYALNKGVILSRALRFSDILLSLKTFDYLLSFSSYDRKCDQSQMEMRRIH